MQRTTLVAIAAAVGLGLGVGASFIKAQSSSLSPSPDTPVTDIRVDSTQSPQSDSSPSPLAEDVDSPQADPTRPQQGNDRNNNPQASTEPSPLAFDTQATNCPSQGGGGPLVSLYMTEHHLVYICQGGEGREDWRQLDYYAVDRAQPDDWIRLQAFVTSGPGMYAENGAYRYEIDPKSLTVRENNRILLQEPVLRCKGSCS